MTGGAMFGLLWAAVGIVLAIRWWNERARWLSTAPAPALTTSARTRFGAIAEDGSGRRTAAMLLAYASGTLCVSLGIFTGAPALLGVGTLLVNVGTIFRFLVLAMDRAHLGSPVIPTHRPARHLGQPGLFDLAG